MNNTDQNNNGIQKLKSLYSRAIELEEEMAAIIESGKIDSLHSNTRQKKKLMAEIEQIFPAAQIEIETENKKSKEELAQLLQKLVDLEKSNQGSLLNKQTSAVGEIRANHDARKFARGYKPSENARNRSKLDERR